MMRSLFALGTVVLALSACAPADVSGEYTVALTNGANGCELSNFNAGQSTQGVAVHVTQSGANVSAQVQGLAAIALGALVGTNVTFQGTVTGTSINANIDGSFSMSQGGCAYTYRAELRADLSNNTLNGTVTYKAVTNGHADCGTKTNCASVQTLAGARPPR